MRRFALGMIGMGLSACSSAEVNGLVQLERPLEPTLQAASLEAATGIYKTTTWLRSEGCGSTSTAEEDEAYFIVAYEPGSTPPAAWMSTCLDEAACQGMLDAVAAGQRPYGTVVGWVNASNGGSRGVGTLVDRGVAEKIPAGAKCLDAGSYTSSFGSTSGGEASFEVTEFRSTKDLPSTTGECTLDEVLAGLERFGACAQYDTVNGLPL